MAKKEISASEVEIRGLANEILTQLEAGQIKEVNSSNKTLENRLKRVEETDINVLFKEALNGSLKKIDGVVYAYNKAMKGARMEAKTLADILGA
ncbi:hypothetical protein [Pseudolactococcus reticulitermitis]|uniref:Uncharacterized protein n=1 Tax=Pseudolactococcus reticulitermitis TaxID=2025039 RepID=A0A224XA84_9LACT|nr:hypothetical protein [Lactococcus reticulitermitis]GAX46862.1 hypothetical protein RsY01_442 [Lactococcus reticulitermitis]